MEEEALDGELDEDSDSQYEDETRSSSSDSYVAKTNARTPPVNSNVTLKKVGEAS